MLPRAQGPPCARVRTRGNRLETGYSAYKAMKKPSKSKAVHPVNISRTAADRKVMTRGRRNALRSLCADLLKIRWTDESGAGRREVATLEDISPTGACLKVENPIPVGTTLTILYPSGSYQGRVQHCDPQMDWYFVGVEFTPGYRWSREQYEPAHLLQFRFRAGKQAKAKPPKSMQ
jgi:hypothetical protein